MREIVSGLALMVAGAAYGLSAVFGMSLGTLRQMGPGLFPAGLGGLLFLIGVGIFVEALFEERVPMPKISLRVLGTVLASVVVFGLLIRTSGLFPAIVATTAVSSFAMPGMKLQHIAILMVGLMAASWVIFVWILELPVPIVGAAL